MIKNYEELDRQWEDCRQINETIIEEKDNNQNEEIRLDCLSCLYPSKNIEKT